MPGFAEGVLLTVFAIGVCVGLVGGLVISAVCRSSWRKEA